MIRMQGVGHENHEAKQSQQAGSGPSNGERAPLPLLFQAEMGADFADRRTKPMGRGVFSIAMP
jgi:hypothetical protein